MSNEKSTRTPAESPAEGSAGASVGPAGVPAEGPAEAPQGGPAESAVPLTRPRRLQPGDRVGIVAPSGPVPADRLEKGLAVLRDWGLEPVVAPHVLDPHPTLSHLASLDEHRVRDLEEAWCDPSLDAVVSARGGYGTQRVLDRLDWDRMRAAGPKLFVGYSDLTVLHEAVAQRLGLATLHGPMVATLSFIEDKDTQEHLRRSLFAPEQVQRIGPGPDTRTVVSGRAHGVTLGGNLSLLAAERGTPYARPCGAGAIVLLEDIDQPPYSLDRLLTQLLRGGFFDGVAGIALGSWTDCGDPEEVSVVLRERLEPLGVPLVEELGFGHGPSTPTLPLGVPAVLDADAGTLTYEQPGLV